MTTHSSSAHAARLRSAAYEMLSLADEIENHNEVRQSTVTYDEATSKYALTARAAKIFTNRELRKSCFNSALLGEPAWDMLLYLFVKAGEDRAAFKTAVTSASGAPHATALRYLALLEADDIITIEKATVDQRVQLVSLTRKGLTTMANYLGRSIQKERLGK